MKDRDSVVRQCRMRGIGSYRSDAEALMDSPGDVALVQRGVLRSLLMTCPDGCGETLVVNLDGRAGRAWRLYTRPALSLYPSIWREGGCGSHFILWRNHIVWCDDRGEANSYPDYDNSIEERVLAARCLDRYRSAEDVAAETDETPWDALRALRRLASAGVVEDVWKEHACLFRRTQR